MLSNRTYSLHQALQAIRTQPTQAGRRAGLAALRQLVAADQAALQQVVANHGGTVERQFWHVNAMAVDVPPAAVATLRAMPRVAQVTPVRAYSLASTGVEVPMPTPIDRTSDQWNHNVAAAWAILGGGPATPYRGAGARIAVFDSGIDADVNGTNGAQIDPHPSFVDNLGATRVEAHLQAQVVGTTSHADVNICQSANPPVAPRVGLLGPHGWRAGSHHENAAHGTAMAAIAAGRPMSGVPGVGHAPDATLLDVACTSYTGAHAGNYWVITDLALLSAIEVLREYMLDSGTGESTRVHVANMSFHGDPSPDSPVCKAIDALARQEDILIVASGGNEPDTTESSLGFFHGLAVGSVHARHPGDGTGIPANLAFVPMLRSSRGPHFSDHRRFYPDVCATGAGPGTVRQGIREFLYPYNFADAEARGSCLLMPGIDTGDFAASLPANNVSPRRYNLGTSQACAQVAGAAALYRGRVPSATAEETRAAILLNVLGTFVSASGQTADTGTQHTYTNRNTFGVGYVRDDLLAQFAVRDPAINALAESVTLSAGAPVVSVNHAVQAGARYGVVACWRRNATQEEVPEELDLPNVDLEVVQGVNVLARSATLANSYERLVYIAPPSAGGPVSYRVRIDGPVPQSVAVQVVAREFATDLDPATAVADPVRAAPGQLVSVSAGAGCTAQSTDWSVARIVPTDYANAYGSSAFAWENQALYANWYKHLGYSGGFDLARGRVANGPQSGPEYAVHVGIGQSQMGGAINIAGLSFRTWAPFAPTADATITVLAWIGAHNVNNSIPQGAVTVATSAAVRAPGAAAGEMSLDNFAVILPFDMPFYYAGSGTLNLWFRVSASATPFVVDGVSDGVGSQYSSSYKTWTQFGGNQVTTTVGHVPILGLVAVSAPATWEPRLEVFMEPWSANSVTTTQLDWRLSRAPGLVGWVLVKGDWSPSPISFPPCSSWLVNPTTLAFGMTTAHGLAGGTLAVLPQFVHADLGLQVALTSSLFSNAVRVTVGGGL